MSSIAWDEAVIAFKALADQADEPAELWSAPQRLAWLDNVETLARILPALQHQPINDLLAQATTEQVGGSLQQVLADRLRINRAGRGPAHRGGRRSGAAHARSPVSRCRPSWSTPPPVSAPG